MDVLGNRGKVDGIAWGNLKSGSFEESLHPCITLIKAAMQYLK